MPEGDTIHRTARTLHAALSGRTMVRFEAPRLRFRPFPEGTVIEGVEAKGKHCLVRFDDGRVLHTHMRMTGSWHVYSAGERWRRPPSQARVVLTCGDRVAVCFNAPVVELLRPKGEQRHPALTGLGLDILASSAFDADEARRRVRSRPPDPHLGEQLGHCRNEFGGRFHTGGRQVVDHGGDDFRVLAGAAVGP